MNNRITPLLMAAAGAVLAVGVFTFAGACVHEDGSAAACAVAAHAVLAGGIVAAIAGLGGAAVRSARVRMILSIVGIVAGIFAIASPGGLFPLCMMQTMRCWTIMRPFSLALGAIIAIAGTATLVGAYMGSRKTRKSPHRMAS